MIDVEQAVKAAIQFAEDALGPNEANGARLEEIEMTSDEAFWLITPGLPDRAAAEGHTVWEALSGASGKLDYKGFKVDVRTGKVVSMKMRNAA